MLTETNCNIRVVVLRHYTRQGTHEYLIELYADDNLVIGGVTIEGGPDISEQEILDRTIQQYLIPSLRESE